MATKQMSGSRNNASQKVDALRKKSQTNSGERATRQAQTVEKVSSRQARDATALTHEQIAERAKAIWQGRGCPANEDVKNWLDAESQLKQEIGVH